MKRRTFFGWSAAGVAAPQAVLRAEPGQGGPMRVGFAERDITPSVGMEQPGGYGKAFLREFHDACKVRACVFDDGKKRAALVGVDALMVPRELVLEAREEIADRTGMAGESIMIGASHSHSSGPTGMVQPGEYDHASPFVQKLAYEMSSMADAGYLEKVRSQIVNAVCEADKDRAATQLNFGMGKEPEVGFNRRFRMKNGQSWSHPGQGNPDIVEPAGPIDPGVGVIGSWDKDGRLLGCVVNYACHATTNPTGISANWIYYLEQTIRGVFGPDVVVVFLQGFSGDVTQVDNRSPYQNPSGDEWARLVGGRVGAEAVKVLLSSARGTSSPVEFKSDLLWLERRAPSAERLKKSLDLVRQDPKQVGATEWTFAKEIVLLDAQLRKNRELEAEVQTVQVGPCVFASAPGEMFCQLGLDIRAGSQFKLTFPVSLANGCIGYVPTEEAMGKRGGGYETRMSSYSSVEPAGGRKMVETAVKQIRLLTPGRMPARPPAPTFNADPASKGARPWSYGNVPPEHS